MQYDREIRPIPPSFLSIDAEAVAARTAGKNNNVHSRVLRFDSLSKVISSGLRIGFVKTAQTSCRQNKFTCPSNVLAYVWYLANDRTETAM